MRKLCLAFCIVLSLSGCAQKEITDPVTRRAYTANQIVIRVGEIQNAVIAACAAGTGPTCTGSISTETSRTLVQFTIDAAKILNASPQGWESAVLVAWAQAKMKPELQTPSVRGFVLALDTLIGGPQ